jgi:hypothetical protein
MPFKLGTISMGHLRYVKPALVACVEKAITVSNQDFRVNQGLRTLAEQKTAVARCTVSTLCRAMALCGPWTW